MNGNEVVEKNLAVENQPVANKIWEETCVINKSSEDTFSPNNHCEREHSLEEITNNCRLKNEKNEIANGVEHVPNGSVTSSTNFIQQVDNTVDQINESVQVSINKSNILLLELSENHETKQQDDEIMEVDQDSNILPQPISDDLCQEITEVRISISFLS